MAVIPNLTAGTESEVSVTFAECLPRTLHQIVYGSTLQSLAL